MQSLRFGLSSCRPSVHSYNMRRPTLRPLSALSTHRVFPATLLRINAGAKSDLYAFENERAQECWPSEDAVQPSDDGLIRQAVFSRFPFSNGAILMPNTFMMQELVRGAVDNYMDNLDNGLSVERPTIFTIRKGTAILSKLVLVREHTSQFSLQPSEPMTLSTLNDALTEFYSKHGEGMPAEQWLDEHEFTSAHADDAEAAWMAE